MPILVYLWCALPLFDSGDLSLWGILRKNIGKDLSKISMPVSLNEPLSALQRLCEELEYSELLDEASRLDNPCDRMVRGVCGVEWVYVGVWSRCMCRVGIQRVCIHAQERL